MSFSNIEVNYSNDTMSLHVMIDLQCPNNAGGIAALNSHGKSLTQEQCYYYYYYYYYKTNCENINETDDRHSSLAINIK